MESETSSKSSFATRHSLTFGATALPLVSAFPISLNAARWIGPVGVGLISRTTALPTAFIITETFDLDGTARHRAGVDRPILGGKHA